MELQLGELNCSWENGSVAGRMELQLGEWNCSWENGSVAGRMELQLGKWNCRWENGISGAFSKFIKTIISFVMSVCPSAWKHSTPNRRIILACLSQLCRES